MDDDIVVGEIELGNLETSEIISELNIESEENHETHSENMDDYITLSGQPSLRLPYGGPIGAVFKVT